MSSIGVTETVRERGVSTGTRASYLVIHVGASNVAGHHTARFDIDEDALELGVDVVTGTVRSLGQ